MTMKRRSFLTMLGAAVVTPALPVSASAMPANIGGLAAVHAKTYPFVSVTGLSKRLGLTIPQAQKVLVDLSRKGLVSEVHRIGTGPIHAASKVFKPKSSSLIRAAQAQRAANRAKAQRRAALQEQQRSEQPDLTLMLRHLQSLCTQQGMVLQPRALAAVA